MELVRKDPSSKGTTDRFIGDVWVDRLAGRQVGEHIRVNVVRFAPGARNAWHTHAGGQTLHVTEGVGLVQSRGEAVREMRAGDTVRTPPGEWHWHGAAPDRFMTHLAIWEGPADGGPETEWGALVTDDEYSNGLE